MKEALFRFVKEEMNQYVGHDFDHSVRVHRNAMMIAQEETCDMMVVEAAAIVHDYLDHKFSNETTSRKEKLSLVLQDVGLASSQIDHVITIIDTMSFTKGVPMTTMEGMIVQDADRLDALGAIGIARTFAYGGHLGRPLYGTSESSLQHFDDKLFKLKNLMNTSKGKVLAIARHEFMLMYIEQLAQELRI